VYIAYVYASLCVRACGSVVEVNVVDTSAGKQVDDVTFPRQQQGLSRQSSLSAGGDSIRLTGDTIRQLGADGMHSHSWP